MAQCFYCRVTIHRYMLPEKRMADNHWTADHVYPTWLIKTLDADRLQQFPTGFTGLNRVNCCHKCNQYKGRLHPLDWLVIMPDNDGAKQLAQRLVKMGEDMAEVFDAVRRRRR